MADFDFCSRLIIVCGHFGAGKTNVSVNLAVELKKKYESVTVVDFDIVNPYFRTKDAESFLSSRGINSICPDFANTNVDIPSIPPQVYSIFEKLKNGGAVVLDVGGDALGAAALGFLHNEIISNGYEMLYVFNCYRPITPTPEDANGIMLEIQNRSRLRCTALINNSNLGEETTSDDITASLSFQNELERISSLPTRFVTVRRDITMPDSVPVFGIDDITKKLF